MPPKPTRFQKQRAARGVGDAGELDDILGEAAFELGDRSNTVADLDAILGDAAAPDEPESVLGDAVADELDQIERDKASLSARIKAAEAKAAKLNAQNAAIAERMRAVAAENEQTALQAQATAEKYDDVSATYQRTIATNEQTAKSYNALTWCLILGVPALLYLSEQRR